LLCSAYASFYFVAKLHAFPTSPNFSGLIARMTVDAGSIRSPVNTVVLHAAIPLAPSEAL
jgi:hypothetical protein